MIPRGEVGLIFASIGRTLILNGERVVNDTVRRHREEHATQ